MNDATRSTARSTTPSGDLSSENRPSPRSRVREHLHPGRMLLLSALALFLLLIAGSAYADGPTGAGPTDPMMVPESGSTIAAQTTRWFYFDYTTEKMRSRGRGGAGTRVPASVTLDAPGIDGITFAIYTPTQAQDWLRDPTTAPVGRGTPYTDTSNGLITHNAYWAGGFNVSGRYLIAVTNINAAQVAFLLTVDGESVLLYPVVEPSPTPTLYVPFAAPVIPTGTVAGKILFETATGGDIYTVNGDGSGLQRLTHGIDPSWSPDGKQIVFARWDNTNPGLFLANADGSNERLLFGANRVRWPRMSSDGKYVVFSQDKTQVETKRVWKLGMVEVATGKLTEPQCGQLCYQPSWGTDGATVYYADPDRAVMATNVFKGSPWLIGPTGSYWDGSMARPIVNWPPIQDTEVSPDGQRIVYSIQAHDRWEVNIVSVYGGGGAGVTAPDDWAYFSGTVVHNVAPTWSPDGKQILFLSDRHGKWEFFVANADGSGVTQVLKNVTDQISLKFDYENERLMDWSQ